MKIRFLEHKKDHAGFAHGFNGGRKKAVTTIFEELLLEDTASFREFVRIDRNHFQFLVKKLWNHLF